MTDPTLQKVKESSTFAALETPLMAFVLAAI
jgi:hypothetical protein